MDNQEPKKLRKNRSREITAKLQGWIGQGVLRPVERLPAERKLAEDLHVSRTSIREAFLILEEKGLVEIKRGVKGGAYVKKQAFLSISDGMNIILPVDSLTLDQIAEFREAIERSVTSIAATKADANDIATLKNLLETARSYIGLGSGWIDEFIEADKAVHIYIAQIAQNPLIANALEAALSLDRYFQRFHRLDPALMEDNISDLERIVEAIENHQPELASNVCHDHIMRFNGAAA